MIKKIMTFAVLATLLFSACNGSSKQENAEKTTTEAISDEVVTTTSTDADGQELKIVFNNTQGTATLDFKGEKIELVQERAGSGFWYKNDTYELRGKGNDMDLTKDGEVIFSHKDDIVTNSLKDKDGNTLDMTFNNSTTEAKVYLNGGEQIDLVGKPAASGIWYVNDQYELRGKGDDLELKKDGEIVFKSK
jgi:membrane-bound inhibitor of C-type lysozyme